MLRAPRALGQMIFVSESVGSLRVPSLPVFGSILSTQFTFSLNCQTLMIEPSFLSRTETKPPLFKWKRTSLPSCLIDTISF